MKRRRHIVCSGAIACMLTAALGCETLRESDGLDSLVILQQRNTGETVGASVTHVAKPGTHTFRISGGDNDGALVKRETTIAEQFNAQWMTIESIVESDGPIPRRTEYWSIDGNGNAVLHATVDHEEEAITLFKPPLITMPAEITAGEEQSFESDVRIVAEHDITRRKEGGTATQVLRHAGSVTMRTARGETSAAKIIIEFEADLAMADAFEKTVRYIDSAVGIVAIQRTRKVNILAMPGSETRETLQLLTTE